MGRYQIASALWMVGATKWNLARYQGHGVQQPQNRATAGG